MHEGQLALAFQSAQKIAKKADVQGAEVFPERPLRQWVLSLPHALRFLLATDPNAVTLVLGVVYRTISRHLVNKAGLTRATGATGAVTLVQRFGSALNLNVHFHLLFLDGAPAYLSVLERYRRGARRAGLRWGAMGIGKPRS